MVNINDLHDEDKVKEARDFILKLGNDRLKLETELREWLSILDKNSIGMDEALIDSDGFPRSDIDVYQVRHARHRIICIRNDLKDIMSKIEEQLHLVHAATRNNHPEIVVQESVYGTAIVRVSSVATNSPADEAGLRVNDQILNFGSVNSDNFEGLPDIINLVRNSLNQFIKVDVLRNNTVVKLYLKPHVWSGSGVLGCIIVPIEDVER